MIYTEYIRYFLTYSSCIIIFSYMFKKFAMLSNFVASTYILISKYYYACRWKEIGEHSERIKKASSQEESLKLFEEYKHQMSLRDDKSDKRKLMEKIIGFYPTKWNYFNFYMNFVFSFNRKIPISSEGWEFFQHIVNTLEIKK